MQEEKNIGTQDAQKQNANTINKNPASADEQRVATNPNPRANENIKTADPENKSTEGVGTEITDGEAG